METINADKNFKLAGYRTMLGMSQKDMAKVIGVTPQSYSNKERGYRSFKDKEKIQIKKVLNENFPDLKIDDIFFN